MFIVEAIIVAELELCNVQLLVLFAALWKVMPAQKRQRVSAKPSPMIGSVTTRPSSLALDCFVANAPRNDDIAGRGRV
jgi:hypothetical protein